MTQANVNINVVLMWTDTRLAQWDEPLPPQLWGPDIKLANSLDGFHGLQAEFLVQQFYTHTTHTHREK